MTKPIIELWEFDGIGVVIPFPSGVLYSNQTMGHSCLHPEAEGVFLPLDSDCDLQMDEEHEFRAPQNKLFDYFAGPKYQGWGAQDGLNNADANFIDSVLLNARLSEVLSVDRTRLRDSHEAWVYVQILEEKMIGTLHGFGPYPRAAILIWPNTD